MVHRYQKYIASCLLELCSVLYVCKSGDIEKGLRAALCAVGSEFQVVAKKAEIIEVKN